VNKKGPQQAGDADSEDTVTELFRAVEESVSSNKPPGEGILIVARNLARQWKIKNRPLFEGLLENNRLLLLAALVVALRRDHQLLKLIQRYRPVELENLIQASGYAEISDIAAAWARTQPKPTPRQKYEHKRSRWHRPKHGLIEYQFGGGLEAYLRKQPFFPVDPFINSVLFSMQNCLDDIFADAPVNMPRLEELFGMDRHRLARALERVERVQRRRYDYLGIVKIMDFLLKEKPRKKRKQGRPGRPPAMPWLNDRDLRARVLSGIEARISSLSTLVPEHIKAAFVAVIRRHLPDSGKK
jgi:hypothetical protein